MSGEAKRAGPAFGVPGNPSLLGRWVAGPAPCLDPDRGVSSGACGLDPHAFRASCENAHGLRAGGLVAVLGGLRARRREDAP